MSGSNSVRGTVLSAMNANGLSSYVDRAGSVIEALEERDRGIFEGLLGDAVESGMNRADAMAALENRGLTLPNWVQEDSADSVNGTLPEDGGAPIWFTSAMEALGTRLSALEETAATARRRGLV